MRDNVAVWLLGALALLLLVLAGAMEGQEARGRKPLDRPYWTAAGVAAAGTALDAWTTVARTHWRVTGPTALCTHEVDTPWLYSSRPSTLRLAGTMAGELTAVGVVSHLLRRRAARGSRLRALALLPLGWEAGVHFHGAESNWENCPAGGGR